MTSHRRRSVRCAAPVASWRPGPRPRPRPSARSSSRRRRGLSPRRCSHHFWRVNRIKSHETTIKPAFSYVFSYGERSTIFNRKIHYFNSHVFNSKLSMPRWPTGQWCVSPQPFLNSSILQVVLNYQNNFVIMHRLSFVLIEIKCIYQTTWDFSSICQQNHRNDSRSDFNYRGEVVTTKLTRHVLGDVG